MTGNEAIILTAWNFMVFFMYGLDKRNAIRGTRRISENSLILPAFLMGGFGAFIGMNFFHHKTKLTKFRVLIPISMFLNLSLIIILYRLLLF